MRQPSLVLALATAACAPDAGPSPADDSVEPPASTPFVVGVESTGATEVALIPVALDADGAVVGAGEALAVANLDDREASFALPAQPPPHHRDGSDRMATVNYGVFARAPADDGNGYDYVAAGDTLLAYVSAKRTGVAEGWYLLGEDESGNTTYDDVAAGTWIAATDESTDTLALQGGAGSLPTDGAEAYHVGFFDTLGRISGDSSEVMGQWSITFDGPPSGHSDRSLGFEAVILHPGVFVDSDGSGTWSRLDPVVATICAGIDEVMVIYTVPPSDPATLWALKDQELVAGWGAYSERPNGLHRLVGAEMGGFMASAECTGSP